MTILEEIIHYKRSEELPRQRQLVDLRTMQARAEKAPRPRDFVASLRRTKGVALIAELKKASPSRGLLVRDFNPLALAQTYVENGAAAVSVLTDAKYFAGSLEYLTQIHAWREASGLDFGLLRKDFVVDPYQVYEARAAGADALLLIAAALTEAELGDLLALARSLGMEALLEVHSSAELESVLAFQPRLIGVNNRDLRSFAVDLNTCLALCPCVSAGVCLVAESGIHSRADVERLARAGIDAILVGESLVTARDLPAQVRTLSTVERRERISGPREDLRSGPS